MPRERTVAIAATGGRSSSPRSSPPAGQAQIIATWTSIVAFGTDNRERGASRRQRSEVLLVPAGRGIGPSLANWASVVTVRRSGPCVSNGALLAWITNGITYFRASCERALRELSGKEFLNTVYPITSWVLDELVLGASGRSAAPTAERCRSAARFDLPPHPGRVQTFVRDYRFEGHATIVPGTSGRVT